MIGTVFKWVIARGHRNILNSQSSSPFDPEGYILKKVKVDRDPSAIRSRTDMGAFGHTLSVECTSMDTSMS